MKTRQEIKAFAKERLREQRGTAILLFLVTSAPIASIDPQHGNDF